MYPHLAMQDAEPGLLAQLGWVDLTALAILAVFLVLGLFRGFVWQLSRIVTLVLAYICAGTWGQAIAVEIRPWFSPDLPPELPLYLAYFALFLGVLIVVSLIAHLLDRFIDRTGLSFYNRVGGGLLGIATGVALVIAMLGAILMFFGQQGPVVQAAENSHALRYGRQVVGAFGGLVPHEIREVYGLEPGSGVEGPLDAPIDGQQPLAPDPLHPENAIPPPPPSVMPDQGPPKDGTPPREGSQPQAPPETPPQTPPTSRRNGR